MKVLVVEDEEDWQDVIRNALLFNDESLIQALKRRGIQIAAPHPINDVILADNSETAREKIEMAQVPFDLVILDLLIPDRPKGVVDPQKNRLLGYQLVSAVRSSKYGETIPIVVYSHYIGLSQSADLANAGLLEFVAMLRERQIPPPNEMLWKGSHGTSALLMKKLVRYAIDLTDEDETRLRNASILVPKRGGTRRVLRELKRMACSASVAFPRSDVLLLGENGVGKTTFARAYHLLRPLCNDHPRLGFQHLDLGGLDLAGSAPNIALFGASDFNGAWSLGAFVRSTLYRREQNFVAFPGQEVESGSLKTDLPIGSTNYPETSDDVDFDGSGTLFLDEVVNIGPEIQAMLLQALSYDLHGRHVYTTGHAPRRLRVGPSLVFATAQQLGWEQTNAEATDGTVNGRQQRTMKDYLFRIDQMRVTIPPLRERETEEVEQLLVALVNKRRPQGPKEKPVSIDPIVKKLLSSTLIFRNNVSDLQRIADQVMPEENTVTWQHVAPLFDRERPLAPEIRPTPSDQALDHRRDYVSAQQTYQTYLKSGHQLPVSRLSRELDISQTEAYHTALVFMDACGCGASKRWPTDAETKPVFGHNAKAFQTYLHRLSPQRNSTFGLAEALRALAQLKGFPIDQEEASSSDARGNS